MLDGDCELRKNAFFNFKKIYGYRAPNFFRKKKNRIRAYEPQYKTFPSSSEPVQASTIYRPRFRASINRNPNAFDAELFERRIFSFIFFPIALLLCCHLVWGNPLYMECLVINFNYNDIICWNKVHW